MPPATVLSKRIYSLLLCLYPSELRRQFGAEMIEVFSEQIRDAFQKEGWQGGAGVWRCVAGETVRTLASSYMQIIGISVVSILATYAVMDTLFWFMGGRH